jgi:hypothetical protein
MAAGVRTRLRGAGTASNHRAGSSGDFWSRQRLLRDASVGRIERESLCVANYRFCQMIMGSTDLPIGRRALKFLSRRQRMTRLQFTFLLLVITQILHSIEEYIGRLYEVFPPARLVSSLISQSLEGGFVIFNVALVSFGLWCFWWPMRHHWSSAALFAWIWVGIELVNGIGHPLWSLAVLRYTPGVATAPVLLLLALCLCRQLRIAERQQADLSRSS